MSAPVTERTRVAAGSTIPAQRTRRGRGGTATSPKTAEPATRRRSRVAETGAGIRTAASTRSSGTQKAYARREERLRRAAGGPATRGATTGRAQFVLLVMVLLGTGLVATLWLSTAAAADSYRLQDARTAARELSSQSERLHREVASLESAPELARRAAGIGMVPVQDPARLVVRQDGTVAVVGVPMPAVAKAPPVPPAAARPTPAAAPVPADAASQTPTDQAAPTPAADASADTPAGTEEAAGAGAAPGASTTGASTAGASTAGASTAGAGAAGAGTDDSGAATAERGNGPPAIGSPPTAASDAGTGLGQEGAGEDGNGAGTTRSSSGRSASAGAGNGTGSTSRTATGAAAGTSSGSRAGTGAAAGRTGADGG